MSFLLLVTFLFCPLDHNLENDYFIYNNKRMIKLVISQGRTAAEQRCFCDGKSDNNNGLSYGIHIAYEEVC